MRNVRCFLVVLVVAMTEQVYDQGMDLVAAVDVVGGAVGSLVLAEREGLSSSADAVVASSVVGVCCSVTVLIAAQTALVGEWDARGQFGLDGSRSAAARMARENQCSLVSARAVVARARRLRSMPLVAAAFGDGLLSVDTVDVLCRANTDGRQSAFTRDEAFLVGHVSGKHFDDVRRVMAYWCDAADGEKVEDRAAKSADNRYLLVRRTLHGDVDVQGRLDAVRGAIVTGELARLEAELFEADWAQGRERFGDAVCLDWLARTPAQRRADALVLMATRSSAVTEGSVPASPLFTVHIDLDTAKKVCELANETVVTPGQLVPWISETEVERVVFGGPSRVLDVGRKQRFFRGALRRAIEVRDRHCTAPGCRVPAHLCEVDHIVEWCDGGETTQTNGRLRCAAHNRQRPGQTPKDPPTAQAP